MDAKSFVDFHKLQFCYAYVNFNEIELINITFLLLKIIIKELLCRA